MAGPLPYMNQLPQDYARSLIPVTAPAEAVPVVPFTVVSPTYVPPEPASPGSPSTGTGGAYVGSSPPSSPSYGWLWLNTNNNGLYVYGDPGVWTQIGTNW